MKTPFKWTPSFLIYTPIMRDEGALKHGFGISICFNLMSQQFFGHLYTIALLKIDS